VRVQEAIKKIRQSIITRMPTHDHA
jgi:hypothetical protein